MASRKEIPSVEADLKGRDTIHLACRDFMHAWEWQTDFVQRRTQGRITSVTRTIICIRCDTVREDEYELPSFQRIKSNYTYPDDYLIAGHKGHIPVAAVRAEIMRRFKAGAWNP